MIERDEKGWQYGAEYFRKAVKVDENNETALFNLAIACYSSNQISDALQYLKRMLYVIKNSVKAC
jgi:cytochrome c-type biogenesis protein CcmH/NrfG